MGNVQSGARVAIAPAGYTLVEAMLVIVLVGVLVTMALPGYASMRDRLAVEGAASGVVRALFDARSAARRLGARAAVAVDTQAASLTVHVRGDTLVRLPLQQLFGVGLRASRDSIAYSATGLGFGASNVRLIVWRGAVAETISVSRTGRVRR